MKEELEAVNSVAITTDAWTAMTTHNYITVTCHYISKWVMKSVVLQTRSSTERHTVENLAGLLKSVVTEWGIDNNVVACVHDNASNVVRANSKQFVTGRSYRAMPIRYSWLSMMEWFWCKSTMLYRPAINWSVIFIEVHSRQIAYKPSRFF